MLSLLEVDGALLSHPDVIDAGCIGVAHERFNEVPAAFVHMTAGVTEEQATFILDTHVIDQLERWKPSASVCTRRRDPVYRMPG
jgi:acyl-coenzyme A synthetase/AMP-(fatty) acid ligase